VADFAGRALLCNEGKVAIAVAAAAMIQTGQLVILDGGTTAREIARRLPVELKATRQPSPRCARVELLRDRCEADLVLFEDAQFERALIGEHTR
jgi:DeoR C terminal sensor domain